MYELWIMGSDQLYQGKGKRSTSTSLTARRTRVVAPLRMASFTCAFPSSKLLSMVAIIPMRSLHASVDSVIA